MDNNEAFNRGYVYGAKRERAACRKAIAKPLRELRALLPETEGICAGKLERAIAAIDAATKQPRKRKGKS